jgi:Holliday junction resolvasome RuvABC endonuclease subunit
MSRVVVGSWNPPIIAPGAEALEVAGGIELDTRGGSTSATCGQCAEWNSGEPAEMRAWARSHALTAHDANRPSVLGLDPSLTSFGIAVISQQVVGGAMPTVTAHVGETGKRTATYAERNKRLVRQVRAVAHVVDRCRAVGADFRLAVIEGPIYGMTDGSAYDRAALWWSVYSAVSSRGIPIAVVTPSHREKFITGVTGHKMETRERKQRVLDEMRALWSFPNGTEHCRDPERKIVNNDEADALGLASMGALAIRMAVPFMPRRRHVENVALVTWPTGPFRGAGAVGGV